MTDIRRMFDPKTITLIGASDREDSAGRNLLQRRILGIGRLIIEPEGRSGEFAVVVHDDFHGKGLRFKLVDVMVGFAQEKGLKEVYPLVQSDNTKILSLCRKLGFGIEFLPDKLSRVSLPLN